MPFHTKTTCARRTGWVTSELYYWHDTLNWCGFLEPGLTLQPGVHFENPETKRRLHNLVEATDLALHLSPLRPTPAPDEVLHLVHPQSHIDYVAGDRRYLGGGPSRYSFHPDRTGYSRGRSSCAVDRGDYSQEVSCSPQLRRCG